MKRQLHPNSLKNLKSQKPGAPGLNPRGRPPDALNAAMKKLTKEELQDIASVIIKGDIEQLKQITKDPKQTVLKVLVASVCIKAIQSGDMHALDILLNRLIGKVKEEVVWSGNPPAQVVISLPDNGKTLNEPSIDSAATGTADTVPSNNS